MPWEISHNPSLGCIEVVYYGRVDSSQVRAASASAIKLSIERKADRFLVDVREVESELSTIEIHDVPTLFAIEGLSAPSRGAYIIPESGEIREDLRFFETVCRNRGWDVRLFTDPEEAVAWLSGDHITRAEAHR